MVRRNYYEVSPEQNRKDPNRDIQSAPVGRVRPAEVSPHYAVQLSPERAKLPGFRAPNPKNVETGLSHRPTLARRDDPWPWLVLESK